MMSKIKTFLTIFVLFIGSSVIFRNVTANTNKTAEKISQVMAYSMPNVIRRCQKDFGYSDADMIILEKELKRFLIMCMVLDSDYIGMYSKDVDNLWHSFILFTKEYAEFGQSFAGKFIHHAPEINDDKTEDELIKSREGFRFFVKNYQQIFNEKANDIWFLDICNNLYPID